MAVIFPITFEGTYISTKVLIRVINAGNVILGSPSLPER
jgi:hypothetical protein